MVYKLFEESVLKLFKETILFETKNELLKCGDCKFI